MRLYRGWKLGEEVKRNIDESELSYLLFPFSKYTYVFICNVFSSCTSYIYIYIYSCACLKSILLDLPPSRFDLFIAKSHFCTIF